MRPPLQQKQNNEHHNDSHEPGIIAGKPVHFAPRLLCPFSIREKYLTAISVHGAFSLPNGCGARPTFIVPECCSGAGHAWSFQKHQKHTSSQRRIMTKSPAAALLLTAFTCAVTAS